MAIEIVIGDDAVIAATLKKDDAVFAIDAGATVQACIISTDHETRLSDIVTCSNIATGSDWDNSLVIVEMSQANTASIATPGPAILEIQVDDTIKETFFGTVYCTKGQIS